MNMMTDNKTSVLSPGLLPVSELLAQVQADEGLSATRRRDITSAIRSACRLIGVDPGDAPASHAFFRKRLRAFHPRQAGIGEKRYRNIRADLTFALNRHAPTVLGERCWHDVPEIWKGLAGRLDPANLRYGLSRFIRFCGHHDISPDEVDDAAVERFMIRITETTLAKRPEIIRRRTVDLWNMAVAEVDGWPRRPLTRAPRQTGYCPAWSALPAPLRQDAEAWLDRLAGEDLLAEDGPIRPARPATIAARRFQIRQIAGALVKGGYDLETLTSLADLVDPTAARIVLRFFLARSGSAATSQTAGIAGALVVIAQHWVKAPSARIEELRHLKRKVTPRQEGLTEKNRDRLRQFDSERNKAALLLLPHEIAKKERRRGIKDAKSALAIQSALMVELLLMAPIRLKNLAGLDLERDDV